jgi:hypothetical protein
MAMGYWQLVIGKKIVTIAFGYRLWPWAIGDLLLVSS